MTTEPVGARIIAFMRCVVALSGLAVVALDPPEPSHFLQLTYVSVSAYGIAALLLYLAADRPWVEPAARWSHWVDVAFATYLIALTRGTSSIFFFLFLFAMLVASFTRGLREGLLVTCASAALFMVVGFIFVDEGDLVEFNRALIRPIYMLVLGTMVAYWGGSELESRRRLLLLRELGRQWGPKASLDRVVGSSLDRLREFFSARQCVLVIQETMLPPTWSTYVAAEGARNRHHGARPLDEESARVLLGLPQDLALAFTRDAGPKGDRDNERLASLLDADAFITVPYAEASGRRGRLYLATCGHGFGHSSLEFLRQAVQSIAQTVENARLTEKLLHSVAEQERYRISLDIHDTTVQPYIGLKLGLDALYREVGDDHPLSRRVRDLLEMADGTINDLRGYAAELRHSVPLTSAALAAAVRRQAEQMRRFHGIEVDVRIDPAVELEPHLTGEVFRIVAEGLNNAMKHTISRKAYVEVERSGPRVRIAIGNETRTPGSSFVPRSISERARALGGEAAVRTGPYTVVQVDFPA